MLPTLFLMLIQLETGLAASNTLTLKDFLQKAQVKSPEIAVEKSLQMEARAKADGIRMNPPMVGFMTMREAGRNNRGIEVTQEIPFPSKIAKEKEVRNLEAQAQNSLYFYRKNEIGLEARFAYFEFWKAFENKKILEEKLSWLKNHVKISRSTARSDSSAQIHLLGTESEADLLENEVLEAQTELTEKINALRLFVPDLATDQLSPETEPKLEEVTIDQKAKSNFISWKENEFKSAEALKSLRKQAYLPDLVLRYRSYEGNEMAPRNEEVMVGVTLPFLFFWQPQAEVSEASAKSQRAQAELQKAQVSFETKLTSLNEKSQNLKKQIMTLREKLIPRAHKRMKLVENLSARTMEGLEEHRLVMLDYLDLRKKEVDARIEFEKTMIEILKIVNKEVDL